NWLTKSYREYSNPRASVSMGSLSFVEGTMAFPAYSYRWAGLDPETGEPRGYLEGEISKNYNAITSGRTQIEELVLHGSAGPLLLGTFRSEMQMNTVSRSFDISYRLRYYFRRVGSDYNQLLSQHNGHIDFKSRWQTSGD